MLVERRMRVLFAAKFLLALTLGLWALPSRFLTRQTYQIPAQCSSLNSPLDPPLGFTATRVNSGSDRFVSGTRPTLLKNAKILTGARNGTEVIYGDVLLDKGVIMAVGYIPEHFMAAKNLDVIDAAGKWISPGLVDAHSHLGVNSAPALSGASDGNSLNAPILPWLRSIDGLNTHDDAYRLAVAGGVTTAQILPGSANNIGGQAFLVKLRPTVERSSSAMVLEPPQSLFLNSSTRQTWHTPAVRTRTVVYGQTRMDAAWNFRQAYNEARKIREAQDDFCAAAQTGKWDGRSAFPESLQWEALVDVLRGRVKLSVHCYEAVDFDALIRLSNEFKFPIASVHHAGEAYLVPDLLKRAWGNPPAVALFASNFRKKREAYRGSEFAPRILADNGLPVIMKSDHPVLNSRYLMYEAQQAHYYSFNTGLAIGSVTSTPANALGVGWRVGTIAEGYDADLVLWDSHPLALGATPIQVFIDGIPQLHNPATFPKPDAFQHVPHTPSWEQEVRDTIAHEGLPPLTGRHAPGTIAFIGVRSAWVRRAGGILPLSDSAAAPGEMNNLTVIVHAGRIACAGAHGAGACADFIAAGAEVVDLQRGTIAPGLTTFGSDLGLSEILLEASTRDGPVFDALTMRVPSILGHTVIRAVDGLQFGGRNTLLAYRAGVTTAVVAPIGNGFLQGVGTAFDVGSPHALAPGAIVQEESSLHISLHSAMIASVSTQVAALRRLLFDGKPEGPWIRVRKGEIPLVIKVNNADIMASLLQLKHDYEARAPYTLQMTFTGASEAHLLAAEIGAARVSVILSPARPYPGNWDARRILPGPPLTTETATTTLLKHGVNVGLGVSADYDARNARFEIAWAALDSNGAIDYATALALSSTNIEKALGINSHACDADELVVLKGGDMFDFESKVIGVVSTRRGAVEFF
ncbi:hypothetical protein C8F04DRAFT_1291263 [Mycena alexandri]|uniref:Amidohydrolase-related domain-containing protein n=1 Tax=Mycena alexandri TaxID=1745969 RepID=A0AAD6SHV9_9AGAR|nr:hypothetical protein C8F04DRAFT_1291263 [Mycena alexandri]